MVTRKPISPPEPTCTGLLECLLNDPLAVLLLATGTSVFLVLLAFAIAHLADARDVLEEERSRVRAEARAFASFAERVAEMDPSGGRVAAQTPGATTVVDAAASGTRLQRVRDAYRDTVMAVPHYDDEYGERLSTNMTIEFGKDVANAVDTGAALTPQLKGTLVERSRTAHDQRVTLLRQLEGETEALEDAENELATARRSVGRVEAAPLEEYSFDQLVAEWHLLSDRQRECEAVLTERQGAVQARDNEARRPSGGPTFEEYLYDPLEVTYPVLADGAELLERIEDARQRVEAALATRT